MHGMARRARTKGRKQYVALVEASVARTRSRAPNTKVEKRDVSVRADGRLTRFRRHRNRPAAARTSSAEARQFKPTWLRLQAKRHTIRRMTRGTALFACALACGIVLRLSGPDMEWKAD